ncbi:HvfC/BufC N-terminal domain-containing protein [Flavobacterium branchiophilum]|uniref:Uncharacterized protein n=1 Tax=Flavobacterium branchiophilum TaxID=55197 RepID=A0A2H3KAS7_9FLAO|nr:putative DNA-binding domain-containing protein [Flavobacterium branchiophilum]PDS23827.1 hypothetical protein B0A77_09550 [Flavobacterium branchiophilum]
MTTKSHSFSLQMDLGNYCRTGVNQPETSIQEHTFQYRRLVFNVVKDTLKNAFPLTRKHVGKKRWKKMVSYFFENHQCQTPQVWKLPQEFCDYYEKNPLPFKKEFDFIQELLQYEWLEIEVFMMEDLPFEAFKTKSNSNQDIVVPNPEIRILPLSFPIHQKKIKKITKADKGQYFVAIHRNFETKQVSFHDLSYPVVALLLALHEKDTTTNDLIQTFTEYEKDIEKATTFVKDFIAFAQSKSMILGYKKT